MIAWPRRLTGVSDKAGEVGSRVTSARPIVDGGGAGKHFSVAGRI